MTGPVRRGGRRWKRLRDSILASQPLCAICRYRPATTFDHVVPVTLGGPELDPANCRPSCAPCNIAGGARITNARKAAGIRTGPAYYSRSIPEPASSSHSPMWCTKDTAAGCICTRDPWG